MSQTMKKVFFLVALSALLAGCAVFASKADYAAYRDVRMAEDDRAQVVAMQEYMSENPEGSWATEIQAERVRLEPEIWESNRSSKEGLEFYLSAFPDGPHAAEARPRLAALQTVSGRRDEEAEEAREVERQRREALLERQRTWLTRATQFWTRTMISINNWGSPISDVARRNRSFSEAFGVAPRPRCSETECIKFYMADYAIPVPGSTRIERKVELMLRLRMTEGRVVRAELLMPNKGFSRWYEQENRTVVVDEDPTQRSEAIEWALARIVPAIREVAPNASNLDIFPEPIDPPTVRHPDHPELGAAVAPGDGPIEEAAPEAAPEVAAAPEEAPAPEETPQETPQEGGGLDDLLSAASGTDGTTGQDGADPVAQAQDQPEEMVLPIALQGFSAGGLRIALFAAGEEDYGMAYDGLFIEFEAPRDPEPEGRRRGRRRRGGMGGMGMGMATMAATP
ncbi:MAG: hypothetical protein DRJ42_07430 [Deltaproteobacteria bacterium]|nr:MAG: hypothetical protein DRJ42_07430 [Deltaproteobacteria bacterium]